MKATYLFFTALLVLVFTATGCKKCRDEDPQVKVINNTTSTITAVLNGSTTTVKALRTSSYGGYAAGSVSVTITRGSDTYSTSFQAAQCYEYQVVFWGSSIAVNGKHVDDDSSSGSSGGSWDDD